MSDGVEVWVPVLAAFCGLAGGVFTTLLSLRSERRKVRDELEFERTKFEEEIASQRAALKAEFGTEQSAEAAIRHFLDIYELPYRSFPMIRHYIGGFENNELRRLLVRAGAVRFMAQDGTELWALRDRVADHFKHGRWKHPEAPRNKVPDEDLFPGVFDKEGEY
ncbi:hypothetical protein [Ruegeria sp. HKCCA5014]|uniref:hypothetical protein n=1 Tax=Ruegeria sp. HKCCA5014 TaxID=2682980 RepID=UPI001488891C|nr:hypothetical protein [Ruegeria sp. HKCCA5014]